MVSNYKRVTARGEGGRWAAENLTKAIAALTNGHVSIWSASKMFNIPYSTLYLKTKGWRGRKANSNFSGGGGRYTVFTKIEETRMANLLKTMNKWGFGLSKKQVLDCVQDFVKKSRRQNPFKNDRPGQSWYQGFIKRNSLSLKKPELLEGSRSRQCKDPFIIYEFFDILEQTMKDLNIENSPESIYNCDETGMKSEPVTTKVLAGKGQTSKRVTGGPGKASTTVLACIGASGQVLPPLILHKGKKIWSNMFGNSPFPGTTYAVSDNGWMTEIIFAKWFSDVFLKHVTARPALLIFDGHLSHVGLNVIETAIKNQITILRLPPHTSHLLQPLDTCIFKGFKDKWDAELENWNRHNLNKILSKSEFANLLGKHWTILEKNNVINAFEKTGIFPPNKNKIDEDNFDLDKLKRYKNFNSNKVAVANDDETPGCSTTVILNGNPDIQTIESPIKIFEKILLNTVKPEKPSQPVKRKLINAKSEIITTEEFLEATRLKKQAQLIKPKKSRRGKKQN